MAGRKCPRFWSAADKSLLPAGTEPPDFTGAWASESGSDVELHFLTCVEEAVAVAGDG